MMKNVVRLRPIQIGMDRAETYLSRGWWGSIVWRSWRTRFASETKVRLRRILCLPAWESHRMRHSIGIAA